MKVKITKPIRINCLSGECEVTPQEYNRLLLLNAIEPLMEKKTVEIPEAAIEKQTRKKK